MSKYSKLLVAILLTSSTAIGCSGMRTSESTFETHAESFRFFGYVIPEDDQARAKQLVPAGATIVNIDSSPADWDSVIGFIGNLFWFGSTDITGNLPKSK